MINLDVDAEALARKVAELEATETQANQALASTLRRMAAWVTTRSLRGLSAELEVQQKLVRRRLRSLRIRRGASGSSITVWYGLDPIALIHLGARQTAKGVTAGKHKRDGAFIAGGNGGSRQVFKRTGKARLPIEKQALDISEKANVYLEDNVLGDAAFEAQFFRTFEHELQWRTRTRT